MKKIIACMLALTLALGLFVGCGTPSDPGAVETDTNAPKTMDDVTVYTNDTLLEGIKQLSSRTVPTLTETAPELDTVIATCADHELTNRMFQFFFWMEYLSFLGQYGQYLDYFGLDTSKSLSEQQSFSEGLSWEQYFLESALVKYQTTVACVKEAELNGFQLPEDIQAQIDAVPEELESQASTYGFPNGDLFLKATFGLTVTVQDYLDYLKLSYLSTSYQNELYSNLDMSREALAEYFNSNESFAQSGLSTDDDTPTINVRHILIKWEDADGDGTPTEEEKAAALEQAESILAEYQKVGTEEKFAELANQYSTDGGSNTNGGLYEDVYIGQMVTAFNEWCFDSIRVTGDTGIVETNYGFHIMYFVGRNDTPCWMQYALNNGYASTTMQKLINDISRKYELKVALDLIVLNTPAMYTSSGESADSLQETTSGE